MSETLVSAAEAVTDAMRNAIVKAANAYVKASTTYTLTRINLGRAVGRAAAAMAAAGADDDAIQAELLPTIHEVTFVDWKTVKDWIGAAAVRDSIAKSVNVELADSFNVEALKSVGQIPEQLTDAQKSAGRVDRATFAQAAHDADLTVRDLREAVKAERSLTPSATKQKSAASQSEETVKALKDLVSAETLAEFEGVNPEVLTAACFIGVLLRDKVRKHGTVAVREGIAEFFTPDAAPTDDGSGAPDTPES